jgi:hypothetical protein
VPSTTTRPGTHASTPNHIKWSSSSGGMMLRSLWITGRNEVRIQRPYSSEMRPLNDGDQAGVTGRLHQITRVSSRLFDNPVENGATALHPSKWRWQMGVVFRLCPAGLRPLLGRGAVPLHPPPYICLVHGRMSFCRLNFRFTGTYALVHGSGAVRATMFMVSLVSTALLRSTRRSGGGNALADGCCLQAVPC